MLGEEPDLELVGPQNTADEQVVGPVVTAVRGLLRRLPLFPLVLGILPLELFKITGGIPPERARLGTSFMAQPTPPPVTL